MTAEPTTEDPAAAVDLRGVDEGPDARLRDRAGVVAIVAAILLAGWSVGWAIAGEKPGVLGGLLVLTVVVAYGLKLAAETYLFSYLGADASPRQAAAQRLVGPLSGRTTLRFVLGGLGGVVFPLAAQLLAVGAKNIPPALDPTPAAVAACLTAVCLIPAEVMSARLLREADETAPGADAS